MRLSKLTSIVVLLTSLVACSQTADRVHEENGTAQVNRKLELEGSPFRFALTDEQHQGYGVAQTIVPA